MVCSSVVLVQSAVLLLPKVGIGMERREAEGRAWARKVALNAQGNSTLALLVPRIRHPQPRLNLLTIGAHFKR